MSENMTVPGDAPLRSDANTGDENELSLFDLAIAIAKHKTLVIVVPVLAAVGSAIYSLTLPAIYTASVTILPPQQNQSTSSMVAAQLGSPAGLAGLPGLKTPNDLYLGMLKSRTVADGLIARFNLNKLYQQQSPASTRALLASQSNFSAGKDGLITIDVDEKDPKRAAELANAYVDELAKLTGALALTEASQRRVFFERQLVQAKDNLAAAELSARKALDQGGLVKVDDQGRAMVETTARLRAQITAKEVQIGAMRTFATERNPEVLLALKEVETLKREAAKIEGAADGTKIAGSGSDGKGVEGLQRLRDVKYQEVLFELLARQFELAKIDEAKDAPLIQVIDKAIEPERRSKPRRTVIVLVSTLAALAVAILAAFALEAMKSARSDPQYASRLNELRRHVSWR